ncbi:hypothetical protein [Kitasatospora sp. NPDC002040]|uniref:hypothetical protein n=1 Tax=Kitasatospora sp. NPDC002040 TaxID=3154661 RepID=UPI00332CB23E
MLTGTATEDSRLSRWQRVRRFAVPPSMIETATARRRSGDWAGAAAATRVDVDLDLRSLARTHGRELTARIRADLRHLAPDLLRWHLPRIAPDGLLRPGLTVALARYGRDGEDPVHLVVRTPPARTDAGQRISLALWDGSTTGAWQHPHPHRRFRLDLHRHLWDARRTEELGIRSGSAEQLLPPAELTGAPDLPWATHRWAAEARLLLRAEGRSHGTVTVRLGGRHRLALDLDPDPDRPPGLRITTGRGGPVPPGPARPEAVLPDAATWLLPDLELLRAGLIRPEELHPLVAAALVPDHPSADAAPTADPSLHLVDCRGSRHRIGVVDGVLAALDHDPAELRREELLAALTGTPLPCLQEIDLAHRRPDCLSDVRERLDHGDTAGALAVVERLLGPDAMLRGGSLRDELETAAQRRIEYGLFRSGLLGPEPRRTHRDPRRHRRTLMHPRHASR